MAAIELGRACGVGPTLGQVLLHREIKLEEQARAFLDPTLAQLTPPAAMVDREAAADRIASSIRGHERIVVFGDYDVDGTTSAVILADTLEALGGDVVPLIAERFAGGYGFSDEALARCKALSPKLIVTCDCGSSDHARIADATRAGIDVVVVDHHLVPPEPLPALAFLNPHRPDCGFPYKGMASAGLAFSLAAAVRKNLNTSLDLRPWLDLVALGTVADLAPLDGDNRRLVRAGLGTLMEQPRPGLRALFDLISVRSPIGGSDISFRIAPRLNAPGRLGKPELTLSMLRAKTAEDASRFAKQVEEANEARKAIEKQVTADAFAQIEQVYGTDLPAGLVVASEGWHRGVVGITAARIVDRYERPALVVGIDDGHGHGSGRTVPGFSVHAALLECREHLSRFGGHSAAVGFSLDAGAVEGLRSAFADACARGGAREVKPEKLIDVLVDGNTFTAPSVRDLWRLEPVGQENQEPLFAFQGAPVLRAQAVGAEGQHLKLTIGSGGREIPAFGFQMGHQLTGQPKTVNAVGHFRFDHYRHGKSVEFRLVELL